MDGALEKEDALMSEKSFARTRIYSDILLSVYIQVFFFLILFTGMKTDHKQILTRTLRRFARPWSKLKSCTRLERFKTFTSRWGRLLRVQTWLGVVVSASKRLWVL